MTYKNQFFIMMGLLIAGGQSAQADNVPAVVDSDTFFSDTQRTCEQLCAEALTGCVVIEDQECGKDFESCMKFCKKVREGAEKEKS